MIIKKNIPVYLGTRDIFVLFSFALCHEFVYKVLYCRNCFFNGNLCAVSFISCNDFAYIFFKVSGADNYSYGNTEEVSI